LQALGEYVLGQLAANKDQLGAFFIFGQPGIAGLGAHHHVYALEQHTAIDALQIQNALVAHQIWSKYLNNARQEVFQPFGVERSIRTEHESPDLVIVSGVLVVMMVVVVPAARTAIAFITVGMIVVVIMLVRCIGVLLCQELR